MDSNDLEKERGITILVKNILDCFARNDIDFAGNGVDIAQT